MTVPGVIWGTPPREPPKHTKGSPMTDYSSLNHTRWECKYHVVFIPKYRKKAIFWQIRQELGEVLKVLAYRLMQRFPIAFHYR